jgi:hypothetical protein
MICTNCMVWWVVLGRREGSCLDVPHRIARECRRGTCSDIPHRELRRNASEAVQMFRRGLRRNAATHSNEYILIDTLVSLPISTVI